MKFFRFCFIITFLFIIISSCQRYDNEGDFVVEVIDGGKAVVIFDYIGSKFDVRIPSKIQNLPVTHIDDYTFSENRNLTSIIIPDSVTNIGTFTANTPGVIIRFFDPSKGAFSYCTNLSKVTIGKNVSLIGEYAFYGCSSLTSITIPKSVITIHDSAFIDTGLTSVTFQGNHLIHANAFPGDLWAKFYGPEGLENFANGKIAVGVPGTYTRSSVNSDTWTKQ